MAEKVSAALPARSRVRSLRRLRPPNEASGPTRFGSYVLVLVACIATLGPFLYILSTSFKETRNLFGAGTDLLPEQIFWGNYQRLLTETGFPRWILNTLLVAIAVTVIKLVIDSMAAYAFSSLQYRGKEALFVLILSGLMIPVAAILIPLFFLVRGLGLLNTYWALILPALANPIGIFLLRNFIETLPPDLVGSARLSGASEFAIYRHVVLPLVKAPLVVMAVLTFLIQYTNFVWPLVVIRESSMNLVTTGIAAQRGVSTIDWGAISAGGVMAMIPIALFFIFAQRYFIAGSIVGALKE